MSLMNQTVEGLVVLVCVKYIASLKLKIKKHILYFVIRK